ncbi:hypothetical protein [Cupriavidus metallidurans]|uniref:hypothetical protein n=1 Tax=Cupriavidus metallidurans TaxID=119219 RepID=UPI001CCC2BC7|nr:hypothetical protein [Cupriavidus metallidurans]UBM12784.1 hypothetical protein LAI70_27920 [Cupriavidus metallidurans]
MTQEWNCLDCTAVNDAVRPTCWKCGAAFRAPPAVPTPEEARMARFVNGGHPTSLRELLLRHAGTQIMINCEEPDRQKAACLVGVHGEFFSVVDVRGKRETIRHYPFSAILSCWETDGTLAVEVQRQVFPKGGIAFGMSVPL